MVINVLIPHRHTPYIAATSWIPAILQICGFSWLCCFIFPLEFEDLPKTGWKCTRPPVSCLELKLSGTHTLGPAHPAPLQPRVQSPLSNSPWPRVWHTLSLFSDVPWWSLWENHKAFLGLAKMVTLSEAVHVAEVPPGSLWVLKQNMPDPWLET